MGTSAAAFDLDLGLRPLGAGVRVGRIDARPLFDLHLGVLLVGIDHHRGELHLLPDVLIQHNAFTRRLGRTLQIAKETTATDRPNSRSAISR